MRDLDASLYDHASNYFRAYGSVLCRVDDFAVGLLNFSSWQAAESATSTSSTYACSLHQCSVPQALLWWAGSRQGQGQGQGRCRAQRSRGNCKMPSSARHACMPSEHAQIRHSNSDMLRNCHGCEALHSQGCRSQCGQPFTRHNSMRRHSRLLYTGPETVAVAL